MLGSQGRSLVLFRGDRHEVAQNTGSGRSMEDGFEHVGIRQVAPLRTELADRSHEETPAVFCVKHRSEDGRTVETGQAKPVERAVTGDEACAPAIADDSVMLDWRVACLCGQMADLHGDSSR